MTFDSREQVVISVRYKVSIVISDSYYVSVVMYDRCKVVDVSCARCEAVWLVVSPGCSDCDYVGPP